MPDIPVCTEINPEKAYCVHTISDKEFYWDETNKLNNESYWEARPRLILLPTSSWAAIKAFILKVCKKSGECSVDPAAKFNLIDEVY